MSAHAAHCLSHQLTSRDRLRAQGSSRLSIPPGPSSQGTVGGSCEAGSRERDPDLPCCPPRPEGSRQGCWKRRVSCDAVCMCWSHPLPRKKGPGAVTVGHGEARLTVVSSGSETGPNVWLALSRKPPYPCWLPLPPSGFDGNSAGAGLGATGKRLILSRCLSRAQHDWPRASSESPALLCGPSLALSPPRPEAGGKGAGHSGLPRSNH